MAVVRQRLLDALRGVAIFSGLSDEQLSALRDAMTECQYDVGDEVLEQGDEGDTFYVILEGKASVRHEEEDGEEKVIAQLAEGACIGERALLRSQTHANSVTAESKLKMSAITRQCFEAALGPLHMLLPDELR